MRILYWSPYVGHVGTIEAVIKSATALRRLGGHDVKIIRNHSEWEGYEERINESGVDIVDFGLKKWLPKLHRISILGSRSYMLSVGVLGFFQLMKYMEKRKPHVLITNLIAAPAILATRFLSYRPKVVVSIQGYPKFLRSTRPSSYPLWMRAEDRMRKTIWNLLYPSADLVIAMSKSTADDLTRQTSLRPERLAVIRNPVIDDAVFSKAELDIEDDWYFGPQKKVVAIGRLTEQKDFGTLIRAFPRVIQKIPARLAILGEGEERNRLQKEIDERGLQDHVRLYGFVPNPYPYLNGADLFVLTSLWEDPGHAILEAAALRVPIVSTDCPSGPREIIAGGKGGEICPVGDFECLSEKIVTSLLRSDQEEQINFAYQSALAFSPQAHFEAFQQYFEQWEMEFGS